ncbi:MAG TPA: hypothetical protein VIX60_05585 [Candidatus Cybelea sp.]
MIPLIAVIATISTSEYPSAIRHFSDMSYARKMAAIFQQTLDRDRTLDVGDEKAPTFSGQPWRAASKLADPKKWSSKSETRMWSDERLRTAHVQAKRPSEEQT